MRVGAVLLASAMVSACGSAGGTTGVAGPVQKLTGNELRYGASPSSGGPIVYQPDVVLVGGGADAVVAVSGDGILWLLRGNAPNVSSLRQGDVVLISSFGAGRVLAVQSEGANVLVAIGPAALTDIIRDGTLTTAAPVGVTSFEAYQTPSQPGLETHPEDDSGSGSASSGSTPSTGTESSDQSQPTRSRDVLTGIRLMSSSDPSLPSVPTVPGLPSLPALPSPTNAAPDSAVGSWNVQSGCCSSIAAHMSYSNGGARVQATATLGFDHPSVGFNVTIAGGRLENASVRLNGAARISFGISAATVASSSNFKSGRIQVPVDFAIPIPVGNVPVTIGVKQIFSVNIGLGGEAELGTSGSYAISGALGFSYSNGHPHADTVDLVTTKSALDSIQSIAVAPQALDFAYAVKLSIGVGPPGFSAGIWYQEANSLALATSGSQIDPLQGTSLVTCKTVSLDLQGTYGVGYSIPALVANAINLFLKTVGLIP